MLVNNSVLNFFMDTPVLSETNVTESQNETLDHPSKKTSCKNII